MATISVREEQNGHPCLNDPIAFAHELYSLLAAGGDRRLLIAGPAAYKAFDTAVEALRAAMLSDQPVDERFLCEVDVLARANARIEATGRITARQLTGEISAQDWESECHALLDAEPENVQRAARRILHILAEAARLPTPNAKPS